MVWPWSTAPPGALSPALRSVRVCTTLFSGVRTNNSLATCLLACLLAPASMDRSHRPPGSRRFHLHKSQAECSHDLCPELHDLRNNCTTFSDAQAPRTTLGTLAVRPELCDPRVESPPWPLSLLIPFLCLLNMDKTISILRLSYEPLVCGTVDNFLSTHRCDRSINYFIIACKALDDLENWSTSW